MCTARDLLKQYEVKARPIDPSKATKLSELILVWKHLQSLTGEFVKPLTIKEKGQLGQLHKTLGHRTGEVIAFVLTHWDKFSQQAALDAGQKLSPVEPSPAYLLSHFPSAMKLLAAQKAKLADKEKAKAELAELEAQIDKTGTIGDSSAKAEKPISPEEQLAILAKYGKTLCV